LIVIAILFFTGSEDDGSRLTLLGWSATIFGVLLCAFAAYLRSKAMAPAGAVSAPTAASEAKPDDQPDPTGES
jgi:hypothetical protein